MVKQTLAAFETPTVRPNPVGGEHLKKTLDGRTCAFKLDGGAVFLPTGLRSRKRRARCRTDLRRALEPLDKLLAELEFERSLNWEVYAELLLRRS